MRNLVPRILLSLLPGVLAALLVAPPSAAARGRSRRTIAVLEFRQDVSALPRLAERMAARIRKLTGHPVIGPTEARQKLGADVDDIVARCQGKPACVGALGARLGASEVILIGMSSLGDVIIQISRIRTSTRQPLTSVAHTTSASAKISDAVLDQWIRRLLPARDFLRYGFIQIRSNRKGADVLLDAARRGTTPLPGPLKVQAPSTHDIRVKKDGFIPFTAQVKVPPDATIQVNATLVPMSQAAIPYYKRWWFWTSIASGVAIVVGLSAGLAVGLRRSDDTVPAVIRW